jgi:hypothetical protein
MITISVRSDRWEETIDMPDDTKEKQFINLALAIWSEHGYRVQLSVGREERERAAQAARRSRLRLVRDGAA